MANPEHVEVVKQGADAIRQWRDKHPEAWLDLAFADLTNADLTNADLAGADITRAELWGAKLSDADLTGAALSHAHLRSADLTRTDLGNASLENASLINVDLSRCQGLDETTFHGPVEIAISTLQQTLAGCGGTFAPPVHAFFARAGVPDQLLEYLPDFFKANPIQFYSVFVSYAAKDDPLPDHLYHDLKRAGVPAWKFDHDAPLGERNRDIMHTQIAVRDKVLLVCSRHSLDSYWVLNEVRSALDREKELRDRLIAKRKDDPAFEMDTLVLFPVMLDDYALRGWNPPDEDRHLVREVRGRNIADLRGCAPGSVAWQEQLQRIVRALDPKSRRIGRAAPSARPL